MPATISPDLPSLLTSEAAAAGGAVHAEVTLVTCAEWLSRSAISVPTARAAGAVDAVRGGDDEQQLHVALAELVREKLCGPG